jgi:hypothetical protein
VGGISVEIVGGKPAAAANLKLPTGYRSKKMKNPKLKTGYLVTFLAALLFSLTVPETEGRTKFRFG